MSVEAEVAEKDFVAHGVYETENTARAAPGKLGGWARGISGYQRKDFSYLSKYVSTGYYPQRVSEARKSLTWVVRHADFSGQDFSPGGGGGGQKMLVLPTCRPSFGSATKGGSKVPTA